MKISQNALMERILNNPSTIELMVLDKVLKFMIPFNAPHGFKLLALNDEEVKIRLPFKNKNLNHVKGIHACAIATVGEFCAGMSLIKSFPIAKYRPILAKLSVDYLYQGKTDLIGTIKIVPDKILSIKDEIENTGKSLVELETIVADKNQNVVAKVHTTWQIKSWDKVKTKL